MINVIPNPSNLPAPIRPLLSTKKNGPPISENDKNYVLNIINSFTHILGSAQIISTNKKAIKYSQHNDVLNERRQNSISKHSFSINRYQNQSLVTPNLHANINTKIRVCTRNRLLRNTSYEKIIKHLDRKTK